MDVEDFYLNYIDKIYTFCLYRTGNRFIAEDLTSETFLKFFRQKWQQLTNPTAYLYRICRNTIIDYYRSHKESVSLEKLIEQGLEPGATIEIENRLLITEAVQEIGRLPQDQKDVILLQYVEGLDNKTIAEIMSKSESAVKSLAHRGLTALRNKLNKV